MKKIIYTIGFLMFISTASSSLYNFFYNSVKVKDAYAQQSQSTAVNTPALAGKEENIFNQVFKDAQGSLDFGQSFGESDPNKAGQNLYATIYKKTQLNPVSDAIKDTASQYGMLPPKMALILGGDITPILQEKPTLSQDEAEKILREMQKAYADRQDVNSISAKIKAKVEPNEIFYNGDINDSGFDLVNDLNNIEIILFKKADKIDVGGALGSTGGNSNDSANSQSSGSSTQNISSGQANVNTSATGSNSGNKNGGDNGNVENKENGNSLNALGGAVINTGSNNENDTTSGKNNLASPFSENLNPNLCNNDVTLQNALTKFEKKAEIDNQYKDKAPGSFQNNSNSDSSGQNNAAPDSSGQNNSVAGGGAGGMQSGEAGNTVKLLPPSISNPLTIPTPAPQLAIADNWKKPELCDDILCLSIDFVKKQAQVTAFSDGDNCIACHIEYINKQLEKTISHSLIPSKVPGNLGEPAKCKNAAATALGSLGMNISFSAIPIITPVKDDLLTVGNVTDEWDSFAAKAGFWNFGENLKRDLTAGQTGQKDYSPTMTLEAQEALRVISLAPDTVEQADLQQRIDNAIQAQNDIQNNELLVAEPALNAKNEAMIATILRDEMTQMNNYFDSFSKIVQSLYSNVQGMRGPKACEELQNKPECS